MTNTLQRPPEGDLHAYVDGHLDTTRRSEIEQWLAKHDDENERVTAWRRQKEALHAAFDTALDEPIPGRLARAAQPQAAPKLWRLAAAVAWLAIGGLIGFIGRGAPPSVAALPSLAHNAAIAYAVYTQEVRHPVEVGADQETHLAQWLSKRLGAAVKAPHFGAEGFDLVGGRLLPGDQGPVALFMYQDAQGHRLTLYVRTDAAENRETAFSYATEGKVGVFYWLDGRLGYALCGELPREQLLRLADAAYKQLSL
jgi:anti-sigma factor RsiW